MKPRFSFRITLLVLFAVLTSGLSGTVLYLNYQRNTESTIQAAESLLEQVASRVFAASGAAGRTDKLIAAILIRALDRYPQMTSGYLANGAGEFYRIATLTGDHASALQPGLRSAQPPVVPERARGETQHRHRLLRFRLGALGGVDRGAAAR